MTGRSELSQGSESHSPAGRDRPAAPSPAAQFRLDRGEMVPSHGAESVPLSAIMPSPGARSRSAASDWISGYHVSPATGADTLVVARSVANPSESGLLEVASVGDIVIHMPEVTVNDASAGISQRSSGLLVAHENAADPRIRNGSGLLVLPTDEDTAQFGTVVDEEKKETRQRTSTEIAVAFDVPHVFLANEVKKRLPEDASPLTTSVLLLLRSDTHDLPDGALDDAKFSLHREKVVKELVHPDTNKLDSFWGSKPGPVEQVCLTALELLDDPEIAPTGDTIVLAPLISLLGEYRKYTRSSQQLPEMPELTATLLEKLDDDGVDRSFRNGIYGILQQLTQPFSVQDKIAQKMYEHTDLDHPLALQLSHPFVAEEVAKRLPPETFDETVHIAKRLVRQRRPIPYDERFSTGTIHRKITFDEENTITGSTPGAFEQVGIELVALMNQPDLPPHADTHVIAALAKLMRDYRIHTGQLKVLPEMPDLMGKLIGKLDLYGTDRDMRNRLYSALEQVRPSVADCESILAKMDKTGDLEHPLAFMLTQALANESPESDWIRMQIERRSEMLRLLEGTNQELFENYETLLAKSRGLVFSGFPLFPLAGKVGMEVEFSANEAIKREARERAWMPVEVLEHKGLNPFFWEITVDGQHIEVRRRIELEHNQDHIASLLELYLFLGDHATSIKDMHFHFDRNRHPQMPVMGQLFAGETVGRYDEGSTTVQASDRHDTYEVRGIFPPHGFGNIHPARIEDVTNMYLSATQVPPNTRAGEQLHLQNGQDMSVKQLTWGHLVTYLPDAQGRLAALMALHDKVALANVNPLAFYNSYAKDSLTAVMSALYGKLQATSDRVMFTALQIVATTSDWRDKLEKMPYYHVMRDVLGISEDKDRAGADTQERSDGLDLDSYVRQVQLEIAETADTDRRAELEDELVVLMDMSAQLGHVASLHDVAQYMRNDIQMNRALTERWGPPPEDGAEEVDIWEE